jgi:hypothetical protein
MLFLMRVEEEAAAAAHEPPIEHWEGATQEVLHRQKISTKSKRKNHKKGILDTKEHMSNKK